ncbi:MAG: hypothetical protein AB1725_04405 [Armatimonadota bacterium]
MGERTLPRSTLGLDRAFPEAVVVLHHPETDRYGCYCLGAVHGLACFSREEPAIRFAQEALESISGIVLRSLTFDEAREVAKSRPLPVVAVILLDDPDHPLVHYVR